MARVVLKITGRCSAGPPLPHRLYTFVCGLGLGTAMRGTEDALELSVLLSLYLRRYVHCTFGLKRAYPSGSIAHLVPPTYLVYKCGLILVMLTVQAAAYRCDSEPVVQTR